MKPLQYMNHTEKGKLLFALFPDKLPQLLQALQAAYENLNRNEQTLRTLWDNSTYTFDYWYSLAAAAAETVLRYGSSPAINTHSLTEKLFAANSAPFVIDCILKQAATLPEPAKNAAYTMAVYMLFDTER